MIKLGSSGSPIFLLRVIPARGFEVFLIVNFLGPRKKKLKIGAVFDHTRAAGKCFRRKRGARAGTLSCFFASEDPKLGRVI